MMISTGTMDTNNVAWKVANSLVGPSTGVVTSAAATSTATGSAATATDKSGISSSDFLTLLVTEMKNQDPTQPTDPNAYIQQLVGVNSLQQLIAINQDLTPTTAPPAASATGSGIAVINGA